MGRDRNHRSGVAAEGVGDDHIPTLPEHVHGTGRQAGSGKNPDDQARGEDAAGVEGISRFANEYVQRQPGGFPCASPLHFPELQGPGPRLPLRDDNVRRLVQHDHLARSREHARCADAVL